LRHNIGLADDLLLQQQNHQYDRVYRQAGQFEHKSPDRVFVYFFSLLKVRLW
jgi:hypothetical protein